MVEGLRLRIYGLKVWEPRDGGFEGMCRFMAFGIQACYSKEDKRLRKELSMDSRALSPTINPLQ